MKHLTNQNRKIMIFQLDCIIIGFENNIGYYLNAYDSITQVYNQLSVRGTV